MESLAPSQLKLGRWLSATPVRVFPVALTVLGILSVLHVHQLRERAPLTELLPGSRLRPSDVPALRIAFAKANLDEFEVRDGIVYVPQENHTRYLSAAVENEAIPHELYGKPNNEHSTTNPFLSRAQQASIEHTRRNNQIREMVKRLPFVDQAWFEMDRPAQRNAFDPTETSAVVSVRSAANANLNNNHVTTIKRMIAGAVAELTADNVVVIDLRTGMAVQNATDQLTAKQQQIQQIAFNQARFYESQFRDSLSEFGDLNVTVSVDIQETETAEENLVANIARYTESVLTTPSLPSAGANRMVSLEDDTEFQASSLATAPVLDSPVRPVAYEQPVRLAKRLWVTIDVPETTVKASRSTPSSGATAAFNTKTSVAIAAKQLESEFERFKSVIVKRLLPLFPDNELGLADGGHSLNIKLIPSPSHANDLAEVTAVQQLQSFLTTNWPSILVLGAGFVLVTLIIRRPQTTDTNNPVDDHRPVADTAQIGDRFTPVPQDAEVRLTEMIEQDPDSAAKIIETWIRDAA